MDIFVGNGESMQWNINGMLTETVEACVGNGAFIPKNYIYINVGFPQAIT